MGINDRDIIERVYSSSHERNNVVSAMGTILTVGKAMSGEPNCVNASVYSAWESYIKATNGNGELLKYRYR